MSTRTSSHALARRHCRPTRRRLRRGVLLLVVMALLALLTLMGLTLVLATAQGRLSAKAAARSNPAAARPDAPMKETLYQILRGSNDPNSVLRAHSLLEDVYGRPSCFGYVSNSNNPTPADVTLLAGGQLIQMNITASSGYLPPYNGAYCGQVITMLEGPAQGYTSRIVGYAYVFVPGGTPYATIQVMTFDGLAPNPGNGTYLGDQFVINGRPFSGTGFGFDLTNCRDATGAVSLNTTVSPPNPPAPLQPPYLYAPTGGLLPAGGPLLSATEPTGVMMNGKPPGTGMPYALLPNHAQLQLTSSSTPTTYSDPAGPGGANETHDAIDNQNMLLALHVPAPWYGPPWSSTPSTPWTKGDTVTPIPSLHRPALVAWYAQQATATANPAMSMSATNPNMLRRKVILRPEPMDQAAASWTDLDGNGVFDYREPWVDMNGDGIFTPLPTGPDTFIDLNMDGVYTQGDLDFTGKLFNPVTGPYYIQVRTAASGPIGEIWLPDTPWGVAATHNVGWDIDNDQDGETDSIWVDVGLPVQTLPDGRKTKTLAAILCTDMDGKINLNAHGAIAQLDPVRYSATAGTAGVPGPLAGTTTGLTLAEASVGTRNFPLGQGYGPAEVNPAYLLSRYTSVPGTVNAQTLNYMTYLMMGYTYVEVNTAATPYTYTFYFSVDGKYGESARYYNPIANTFRGLMAPAPYNSPQPGTTYPTAWTNYAQPAVPGASFQQYLLGGPRPGWSRWIDPFDTSLTYNNTLFNPSGTGYDWVNDRVTLARMSQFRPFLLSPLTQLQGPYSQQGIFFDFIAQNLAPWPGSASTPQANPLVHLPTGHGTPYDLQARGALVTDVRGLPYYAGTANLPWIMSVSGTSGALVGATDPTLPIAATTPPVASAGNNLYDASINALNDVVDSPYELDMTATAQHDGENTGNKGLITSIDSTFTPNELEGVLRVKDPDAQGYRTRLDQLQGIYENEGIVNSAATPPKPVFPLTPKAAPTAVSDLTNLRTSLTTESWDLPVPNVVPTPLQMQNVAAFNAKYLGTGPQLNFNNLSVADLMRARIFAENSASALYAAPNSADVALFGNLLASPTVFPATPEWPLLAPEVVMGLRMDINRLLGNGHDDNGNGVIDEPLEALVGEGMAYPVNNKQAPGAGFVSVPLDHNNDGFWPSLSVLKGLDVTNADMRARQLLAKQLYVMMMLLVDDGSVTANSYLSLGATGFQQPYNSIPANSPVQAAYVIAQWAINVVDFRDRDSIMTPFEFDIFPFLDNDGAIDAVTGLPTGTWDVDDRLTSANFVSPDDGLPYRGLVWGCERPELLLTESVAFHDRGTADTSMATNLQPSNTADTLTTATTTPKDNDFDQVRRPRGSLIVELFNPTNPLDAPQRDLQYNSALSNQPWKTTQNAQPWMNTLLGTVNQGYGVNLSQVAHQPPGSTALPLASPVWRLAIAYSPNGYDSFLGAPGAGYSFDPRVASTLTTPPTATASMMTKVYRAVYFTPYQTNFRVTASPPMVNEIPEIQSFFSDPLAFVPGTPLMVPPGHYALVGPAGPVTTGNVPATAATDAFMNTIYLGQNSPGGGATNAYPKQLKLGGGGVWPAPGTWSGPVGMYSAGGATLTNPADIQPVVGVPIQTNWIAGSGLLPHASTTVAAPAGITSTLRMSISEPQLGYPIVNTSSIADDGFYYSSSNPYTPVTGIKFPQHPFDSGLNPQVTAPNPRVGNGTTTGYTIIFLQRLADPLVPWHVSSNPYITVDSIPVDLTGYNGESTGEPAYAINQSNGTITFDTRRRGEQRVTGTPNPETPNVWSPVLWPPKALTTGAIASPLPSATLGYLNSEYGARYSSTNLGNLPAISTSTGIAPAQYFGAPFVPFPWMPWLNRPYVSQYEMMLVPASSPASLYSDFGMLAWSGATANPSNPPPLVQFAPGAPATAGQLPFAQFRHLLNFFNSQQTSTPTTMANLYRIFEYVHVPSRFAGTQTMLQPNQFSAGTGVAHMFHTPFNWLMRYREPGKVNLNTVFDQQVFQGVMDDYPGWLSLWSSVCQSRQGFTTPLLGLNSFVPVPNPMMTATTGYPTSFANPFRPDSAGALAPPPTATGTMMHKWGYPVIQPTANYYGVNATLLRSKFPFAQPFSGAVSTDVALFDDRNFDPNNTGANYLVSSNTTTPYRHAGRNAYFEYQAFQRLGNLTTNRSNVYAVWITLGKFEVQQVPITYKNPDGYQLIKELGSDTGEIQRQRGFYLIDRSIPVGFSRGENLNAERTLLIERILDN